MNTYIKWMLFASYFWVLAEGLLGPLYAVFAQNIGGDVLDITGAYAIYLILGGIITIWIGRYGDHHPKEVLLFAGYILGTIATFSYLFVDSPLKLFVVQGTMGVALALSNPTWLALFSEHIDKGFDGSEFALGDGGNKIVTGVSVLLGGVIVTQFGFTTLFIIMGFAMLASTIAQFQILRYS